MARGAKPGERRGGRAPGTPNKKTIAKKAAAKRAAKNNPPKPRKPRGPKPVLDTPASQIIAEAKAEIVADHECDPVKILLDLAEYTYREFLRLRDLPGGTEVITLQNGGGVVKRTANSYLSAAHILARDAAPYRAPKLANVAVQKTEDKNITIVVQRQGEVESAHRVIDGEARDVTSEIIDQTSRQVAA